MLLKNGYIDKHEFQYFEDLNPGGRKAVSILYSQSVMTEDMVMFMKKYSLRGSRLWDLYKNVCNQDTDTFVKTLKKIKNASDPYTIKQYSLLEEKTLTVLPYLDRYMFV